MEVYPRYYVFWLLTVFCCQSLAAHHDASPDDLATTRQSPGPSSSIHNTTSRLGDEDTVCMVRLWVVNAFNWSPNVDFRALNDSQKTTAPKDVPTNAAGTHTTTLEWVSGAYRTNGKWSYLTDTTTLTFPTGFSWIMPGYVYYTTSGSSTWSYHNATLSTGIAFPSPISTLPPGLQNDDRGLKWNLALTPNNPMPSQIDYIRSMYPDESVLQSCSMTSLYDIVQVPPAALQLITMTSGSSSASALPKTLATMNPSDETPEARPNRATIENHTSPTTPSLSPDRSSPTRVHHSSPPDEQSRGDMAGSSSAKTFNPETPRVISKITIGTSIIIADSNTGFKIGTKTISPAGSPVVLSSTTYSLASRATAMVANAHDTSTDMAFRGSTAMKSGLHKALATTRSSQQTTSQISVETVSGDTYLVQGHTLTWNSTLTLGSGSVITRVALGTNKVGQTLLLGDSITKAPATSCVGRCSVLRASMQSTSMNVRPDTKSLMSSSSSPLSNTASYKGHELSISAIVGFGWIIINYLG